MAQESLKNLHGADLEASNEWLMKHDVVALPLEHQVEVFRAVCEEVSQKPMYESLLQPQEGDDYLHPGACTLVIETGGSNNRVNVFSATKDNTVEIGSMLLDPILGVEFPFTRRDYRSANHFYDTIVQLLKPGIDDIIANANIQALSIVYSFPGPAIETELGIDIQPTETMTKGFVVPGISMQPVGISFYEALRRQGYGIADDLAIIVGNDVSLGMVYQKNAHMSMIDGTGFNIGIALPVGNGYQIFNTESGDINSFPISKIERELNDQSDTPGRCLAEMIAGGKNLSDVFNRIVRLQMRDQVMKQYQLSERFTGAQISSLLEHDTPMRGFNQYLSGYDVSDIGTWNNLRNIAFILRERATDAIAITAAAQITMHPEAFPSDTIICTAEGSTLLKIPGFAQMVTEKINQIVPQYRFKLVPTSGSAGAAYAGIRAYTQQHN